MKKLSNNFHLFFALSRGSTLFELSLLILLLGLFAVGVLLNFNHSPAVAQTAMFKVANDVRYAQNLAMITGVNHGFHTLSTTRYEIYKQSTGNPVKDPTTTGPMEVDLSTQFKKAGFQESYQVEFNSMGKPVLGGGNRITLTSDNVAKSFSITNNTGMLDLP